jgi:hypothetical protein
MYLVNTLVAVHLSQLVLLLVVLEDRVHFRIEVDQPFAYRFSCIVRTLIERTAIYITYTGLSGWIKLDMINMKIGFTEYPARQPLEQHAMLYLEGDHEVNLPVKVL